MIVYHVIREDKPQYEVGETIISPFKSKRDFYKWKPYKQEAEKLLEEERLNTFPHLPSRYNSLFVAETLEDVENWIRNKYREGAIYYMYELKVISGNIFYTDTDWFEGLCELLYLEEKYLSHRYSIDECISNYWEGKPFMSYRFSLKEGLLVGEVKVISKRKYHLDKGINKIIEL